MFKIIIHVFQRNSILMFMIIIHVFQIENICINEILF